MTSWEQDGVTIKFRKEVGLDELGKAMKAFDTAYRVLAGKNANTRDFFDWLVVCKFGEIEK